jgi:pyruvate,water dikinase
MATQVRTQPSSADGALVVPLAQVGIDAVAQVGGKNASLGEMIRDLTKGGVQVPGGFATTALAYRLVLATNQLEEPLKGLLDRLDSRDLEALQAAGLAARGLLLKASLPQELVQAVLAAYAELGAPAVAVRSSATAEDLPEASFAGQQETFLNIQGDCLLLDACRRCYASLFTDRAIVYRQQHGYDHLEVALSIGVQRMVRSDLACSGVMFSLDTETGFEHAVLLTAAYGLGENVVQGVVNPDEFLIHKPTLELGFAPIVGKRLGSKNLRMVLSPLGSAEAQAGHPVRNEAVSSADQERFSLSDQEALQLARWAVLVERHYSAKRGALTPMDLEWAKDGLSGELFILQARPETVQSQRKQALLRTWRLDPHAVLPLVCGSAIGTSASHGRARVIGDPSEIQRFEDGDVLVTRRTDPDWEPILKKARGVITDQGGRTCHAAIIAREMGITAIVATGDGTSRIRDGQTITLSCCEGEEGRVYPGHLPYRMEEQAIEDLPPTRTRILINLGNPDEAFKLAAIPCDGVGLARLEFIIANQIRIHPLALLEPDRVCDPNQRQLIAALTRGYDPPSEYYVDRLSQGMGRIAAAFYPKPVILRFSDFKSNEYAQLLGGACFEPVEANPMLGWRGASRYCSEAFRSAFGLECQALKRVREVMGLVNAIPMVPFCRTPQEADQVLAAMAEEGLVRGENGLEVYVMAELPSNVLAAEAFAQRFDGFSIGSNDLTQLTLGVDRDSALVAELFNASDPSVMDLVQMAIRTAKRCGRKIGICGQAPSDDPAFVSFLVEEGIDSISLNPDSLLATRLAVAAIETARPSRHGP